MRPEEIRYWDHECIGRNPKGMLWDNVWKRGAIMGRLFREDWFGQRVLEIGIGNATAAAALRLIYLDRFDYVGTDVSPYFCEAAQKRFKLRVANTDILALPRIDGGFTRVLALDTFEHIRPEDREEGWEELSAAMAPAARLFLNIPLDESRHNPEFDHTFTMHDIGRLCDVCGMRLESLETFSVLIPKEGNTLRYAWTVLTR